MTKRQKEFLEGRFKQLYVKGWDQLLAKLKAHGGEMLVPVPQSPEMVHLLLETGRGFDSPAVVHQPGEASQCHKNALKSWSEHDSHQVVMGYGLSDGGLWDQHSWLWDSAKNEIIETTVLRIKYFGVVLTQVQSFILFQQYVAEPDYDKAADRFFACAADIKERIEKEGVASLMAEINAFVACSPTAEHTGPKSIQEIPELRMLDKIMNYKSAHLNEQAGGDPSSIQSAPNEPNLSHDERVNICRRWVLALHSTEISADISTDKHKLILNSSPYPKDIKIKCIGASLHLTNLGRPFGAPESIPLVFVFVYHNRGIIEVGAKFATSISSIISKAIGKSVRVKALGKNITHPPDQLLMECNDPESAWILTDLILRKNGYDQLPQCSHTGGTCPVCGDLLTEPHDSSRNAESQSDPENHRPHSDEPDGASAD